MMAFSIGETVTRKWKPEYGQGTILHMLGDKVAVRWYSEQKEPFVSIEEVRYLKAVIK